MTASRTTERLIRAFLDEGPIDLPDRAYDEVRLQIGHTRQRVVIGPWREPQMTPILRVAIAAAAVIAVVAVGINVLPRQSTVGPAATAPPTPSPSPSPSPAAYRWPGSLPAGTYTTDFAFVLPYAVTFTVGDGWNGMDINLDKNDHVALMVMSVENLYADACSGVVANPPVGPSVDDLATALAAMPGLDATPPTTATLGGRAGRYLEYELAADAGCAPDESKLFSLAPLVCDAGCTGLGPQDAGIGFSGDGGSVQNRAWILDAGGRQRLVVVAQTTVDASAGEVAELQSILDSLEIVQTAPATPAPQASSG
jgi:hypothetical protein